MSGVGSAGRGSGAGEHSAPLHPAVSAGQTLLRESLAHPWTLSDLAGRLYITPSYLVRLFHSATGLSPMACRARFASLSAPDPAQSVRL